MGKYIQYGMGVLIVGMLVWQFGGELMSCGSVADKAPVIEETAE